jgi:hypothetical protein
MGMTKGRESNLMGASLSTGAAGSIGAASGFADTGGFGRGWAVWFVGAAAGLAAAATLGDGLCGFTVTFDVIGFGLGDGRVAFLATAATLRGTAFFGIAFPGFFAALFGFFEGICSLRLQTRERAIIPTRTALYRPSRPHLFDNLTI